MKEYLAFVDDIGRTSDGKYIYRFDFSIDTDIVWGDFWNIVPASIVPGIEPDIKCLSSQFKVIFPYEMKLAKTNSSYSMQDCIDGIIALCFPDIDNEYLSMNEIPLFFQFGEEYTSVVSKLKQYNLEIYDEKIIENGDKTDINNLAENGEFE